MPVARLGHARAPCRRAAQGTTSEPARWRLRGGVPVRKPHQGQRPLCIEHRRLDVIGSGREQLLAIGIHFVVETPTTDHDLELRPLRTQALAEMSRLAQASWGHRPDADKRGAVQVDPGEHFGHKHPGPAHLHPVPRRVEQVSHHLETQDVRLVSSGTPYDPDRCVGAGAGPRGPLREGGRVRGRACRGSLGSPVPRTERPPRSTDRDHGPAWHSRARGGAPCHRPTPVRPCSRRPRRCRTPRPGRARAVAGSSAPWPR